MTDLRLAITGAAGRMGRHLLQAAADQPGVQVTAALEHPASPQLGQDAAVQAGLAPGSVAITAADWAAELPAFDVLIDFTTPTATLAALQACRRAGRAVVIGTTGFSPAQLAEVQAAAEDMAVVMAPNYAVGVNLVLALLEQAARVFGDSADVEVIEAHHRHKVDAPSGTALRMGEVLASALGTDLAAAAVHGREGITGPRKAGSIGFSAIRGGDIVGDHRVLFAGDGEQVEISHRASSRGVFARGALRAAQWLQDRPPGLYGMQDVLFAGPAAGAESGETRHNSG